MLVCTLLYLYKYLLGAILSGEDELEVQSHAKSDEKTLQNTVDELLKSSAGRLQLPPPPPT